MFLRSAFVWLLTVAVSGQSVIWTCDLPAGWHKLEQATPDDTLISQMCPDDPGRSCSVTVRHYPQGPSSLAEELAELRYAVVTRLEGQVLQKEACPLAGLPGLKVTYDGRVSNGGRRKFIRYLTLRKDELVIVHCVVQDEARDLPEFAKVAQSLRFSLPRSEDPE